MDFTLFELHLHDAEFNAPFAARRSSTETEADTAEDASATSGAASKLGPLAAVAALAGLALVARYLRGDETAQSTLDEVEA